MNVAMSFRESLENEMQQREAARMEKIRVMLAQLLGQFVEETSLSALHRLAQAMEKQEGLLRTELEKNSSLQNQLLAMERTMSRRKKIFTGIISSMILTLLAATLLLWKADLLFLKIGQTNPSMITEKQENSLRELASLTEKAQRVKEEIATMEGKWSALDQALASIRKHNLALQEENRSLLVVNKALSASRTDAQNELKNLQRLQQAYQFRLLETEGQNRLVVVEVPPEAQPFVSNGRTYMVIAQPMDEN
ncbi:hypothetical protein OPIT5_00205 (plasmid) [Opitutaceae bacterium TAV5]|nr:hypothetical protein OPIT5_00205 [Opitutaceae bacterium TAV5]